jgi:ABC-2 type transport system permease protein
MRGSVLARTLHDARRGLVWWSLGLAGYVAMIVAVYPTIRDNEELKRLVEHYPDALKAFFAFGGQLDFASAQGYLGGELFSFMIPALLLVVAVGGGAGAIAGEEERGTLDLLLSSPLSRRRIALEKLVALCVELLGLGVVLWSSLWLGGRIVSMGIPAADLAGATASAVLLASAYGAIAFLLGAGTGRKALAIGISIAAAVAAFLVSSLASIVDALEPLRAVSPFHHYAAGDPLTNGLQPWHALFLLAVGATAALAGLLLFDRRDVAS